MSVTRHHFDEEIEELRSHLLEMGAVTEEMVRDSVTALVRQDLKLAGSIIPRDDIVDRMDKDIEARCLRLLALQQPMASDLRLIGTSLKVITDIERIGDHAVDISKITQRIGMETSYKALVDIPRLGDMASAMLNNSLRAFVHHDLSLVAKVIADDDAVDALYAEMTGDLQKVMRENPASVLQASYLLFVAHYLERICDHCTNIVERVSFLETGHSGLPTPEAGLDGGPAKLRLSVG